MSLKTTPDLDLIASQESLTFRALEQVLKNDSVVSRLFTTFVAWRGEDDDQWDIDKDISHNVCPFLKISPWPSDSDWVTESQHDGPMQVRITVVVRGTKVDNLMNAWAAVRNAIFPQSSIAALNAVEAVLRGPNQNLVTRPTIKMQAYGVIIEGPTLRMLRADGLIRLGLLIPT